MIQIQVIYKQFFDMDLQVLIEVVADSHSTLLGAPYKWPMSEHVLFKLL